jgi:CRP-like cAMP-binding protein
MTKKSKHYKTCPGTHSHIKSDIDLKIIYSLPVFSSLQQNDVDKILGYSSVVKLSRKTILFHPGDSINNFDTVLSGHIKIYQLSSDGDEAIIYILSKNESFLFNLFPIDGYSNNYAETIRATTILRINRKQLFKHMKENANISFSVLKAFAQQMSKLGDVVLHMKSMILPQRLAHFIFRLCSVETGSEIIFLPYEKTIIANQLGVTRESLSRAFQLLKQIHVTTLHVHVYVHDVEALRRYCLS